MSTDTLLSDEEVRENAPGDLAALENSLKEAIAVSKKPDEKKAEVKTDDKQTIERPDWIEPKFWTGDINESAQKQAQAYKPLQSAYGRMANDLGTQRKFTDRLLALDKREADLSGTTPAQKPSRPKVNPAELVNDPTKALDTYFEARQKEEREKAAADAREKALKEANDALMRDHPDWQEIAAAPEFLTFVNGSRSRQRLAGYAAQGDPVSAYDLFAEFKASKETKTEDKSKGKDPADGARAASLEKSAGSSSGSDSPKGKIYRRVDLMRLKTDKPEVYADPAFQEEIQKAYRDGRVK